MQTDPGTMQGPMRRIVKVAATVVGSILLILSLALLSVFVHHRIRLAEEDHLFVPLGELVSVDKNAMSLYTEGKGTLTLVFMAGSGTSSPILDFRTLSSELSDEYQIVVVERLGYGFSDVADEPRDLDTVLEETRTALDVAGIDGPLVLVPHSMAVLTAIHWANQYPTEVAAIIGLDAAVPSTYDDVEIPNRLVLDLTSFGARIGITRLFPSLVDDSAAIRAGSLTEHEKDIYRAVFYQRTQTEPMVEELERVRGNAEIVNYSSLPQLPMLFFTSNGDGTGMDIRKWREHQVDFLARVHGSQQVFLDSGHYLHNYEHESIAAKSRDFLVDLGVGLDS